MLDADFVKGIVTLQTRFGRQQFDNEMNRLIQAEVIDMTYDWWQKTCDSFIGTRKPNNPPLLTDFKEAALRTRQSSFQRNLKRPTGIVDKEHKALVIERLQILREFDRQLHETLKKKIGLLDEKETFVKFARQKHLENLAAIDSEKFMAVYQVMYNTVQSRKKGFR